MLAKLLLLAAAVQAQHCNVSDAHPNGCTTFSVGQGTGCEWMCNYCAQQLGTNNYYFTTSVCSYQQGGCVGSPQPGVQYSCCSM